MTVTQIPNCATCAPRKGGLIKPAYHINLWALSPGLKAEFLSFYPKHLIVNSQTFCSKSSVQMPDLFPSCTCTESLSSPSWLSVPSVPSQARISDKNCPSYKESWSKSNIVKHQGNKKTYSCSNQRKWFWNYVPETSMCSRLEARKPPPAGQSKSLPIFLQIKFCHTTMPVYLHTAIYGCLTVHCGFPLGMGTLRDPKPKVFTIWPLAACRDPVLGQKWFLCLFAIL